MLSKEKNTKAVSVVSPPQVSALPPTLLIGSRRARLLTSSAALRSPQTCFRLPHCLGRFAPCGYSLPPALRRADYRLAPVIVLPLLFFLFIVIIVQIVWNFIYQKGRGYSVVLLLLMFLYHISRQENVIPLYYSIGAIEDLKTFNYSPLRGNFGPTSTTCSASPSLSSTHYGLQRQCSARVTRRSAAVEKAPQGRHFHLAGSIMLLNVGGTAIEEHTSASAAEQTPGKTVAIAADASTSTDFPNGQSGTGRLSFRLRKLQQNAKHPAIYDSLRSVKRQAVSRLGAFYGKIVGNYAILPLRSRMATF